MRRIFLVFILWLGCIQLVMAQQTEETPVRFSVGYGFYPLRYENISCFSMKVDIKRENKLPISFFVNSLKDQSRSFVTGNITTIQAGVGISRFSVKSNTWFFDPFVHLIFERLYYGSNNLQYYGLAINGGFQGGYRYKQFAISCSIHAAYGWGKAFYPHLITDPPNLKEERWNFHIYYPTPMLNLSLTV